MAEIQAISTKNKGVQIEGKWHTIIGKAADFIDRLQKGPAEVKMNEEGQITYIRNTNQESLPKQTDSPLLPPQKEDKPSQEYWNAKDARITRQWAINASLNLLNLWANSGGGSLEHKKDITMAQATWDTRDKLYADLMTTADKLVTSIQNREESEQAHK